MQTDYANLRLKFAQPQRKKQQIKNQVYILEGLFFH